MKEVSFVKECKAESRFMLLMWGIIIILCIIFRDKISVESISALIPEASLTSALIILLLFALKSLSIVFYSGILYAVSGIIFPLPAALLLNVLGSAIMVSIPWFIGRRAGVRAVDSLTEKYPKLSVLRDVQNESQIFTCALARLVHVLPSDPLSLYFGASGVPFAKHLTGSLLGLTPMLSCFALMGVSINDPISPLFIFSVVLQLFCILISFPMYARIYKRRKEKK